MKDWRFIFEKWVLGQHGGWRTRPEPEVRRVARKIRGGLFVDIGANEGTYTFLLAKQFRRVYAIEPNPKALPLLRERASSHDNVTIYDKALGDKIGRTTLYDTPISDRLGKADTILTRFHVKHDNATDQLAGKLYVGEKGVPVDVVTYDSLVREQADLVKIDVEGAEFLVLEGMEQNLENHAVRRLIIELHNRDNRNRLEKLLEKFGFYHKWLDSSHLFATLDVE